VSHQKKISKILKIHSEGEMVHLVVRQIRLKPSSSDYVTFAKTTARAMGKAEPKASELKPNSRVLWLANLES
jgi:hypothetical protein